MKYNTEDENLCMWKCHPEKVCVNCHYLTFSQTSPGFDCELYCIYRRWSLSSYDDKKSYVKALLTARNCKKFARSRDV